MAIFALDAASASIKAAPMGLLGRCSAMNELAGFSDRVISVAGCIVVAATFAIVFLTVPLMSFSAIQASAGIIAAEVGFFAGLLLIKRIAGNSERIIGQLGCMTMLCLGFISSFAISLCHLFMPLLVASWYLAAQIAVVAITVLGMGAFALMGLRARKDDAQAALLVDESLNRANKIESIADGIDESELHDLLLRISEDIRYEDASVPTSVDALIDEAIEKMTRFSSEREGARERKADIEQQALLMKDLVKERQLQVSVAKRGGI